jgi:hypothetical protein
MDDVLSEPAGPTEGRCPNCGAPLSGRNTRCEFCRTTFRPAVSEEEIRDACLLLIRSMNKGLGTVSSPWALFCFVAGVLIIPAGVYFLSIFLGINNIARWVLTGGTTTIGFAVFGLMIEQLESKIFEREMKPRIKAFLEKNGVEPEKFLAAARSELKESDTLLKHLERIITWRS